MLGLSKGAPNGALKLGALGIMLVALLAALFGSAGLALRIGEGLQSARDESDPWRRVLRGSIVLGADLRAAFDRHVCGDAVCASSAASAPFSSAFAAPAASRSPPPRRRFGEPEQPAAARAMNLPAANSW